MNKLENNKLIAEFMGLVESSISDKYWTEKSKEGFGQGELFELQYHTSWDWLMPVVEKIYSIDADVDFFKNISLEATYKAVIEFIKWYNNESKI